MPQMFQMMCDIGSQNKLVDLRNMSSSKQFDDLLAQHERQMYGEEEETDQHIEQQEQPVACSAYNYTC